MALKKTSDDPVNYSSGDPEKDFKEFEDVMKKVANYKPQPSDENNNQKIKQEEGKIVSDAEVKHSVR